MQPSMILLMLTGSASAWVVSNCRNNLENNWKAGRCYNYDVGTSLQY
jgi:hypothetical protein